jgi:hypothetical protein
MNNSELEAILKKAQVPARPEEFWEMVRMGQNWFPRFAWGLATAICILAAFTIGRWRERVETVSPNDVLQNTKLIRETLAMFPNRVRAIAWDKNGFNLILSDRNDVPDSTPIYIRICNGKQCVSFVTFSGQEIQIAGQKLTVLSDFHDGIILSGDHFLWSSDGQIAMDKGLKIEAKGLGRL